MGDSCRVGGGRRLAPALALVASVLVAGCATSEGRWTQDDYHLGYGRPFLDRATLDRPLDGGTNGAAASSAVADVSARIRLVADNQRHELLGGGIYLYRNTASDRFIQVAIRPPQLDMFGQELLCEALRSTDDFVLHLGDACDVSNTLELGLFAWDMRLAPAGWAMAPGNHDGYFMGNASRTTKKWIDDWAQTGESFEQDGVGIVSRPLQKDRFVSWYLAAVILQRQSWSAPLARRVGPDCAAILERWERTPPDAATFVQYWQVLDAMQEAVYDAALAPGDGATHRFDLGADVPAGSGVALRRVAWAIHAEEPWKSYVTQEIDISASAAEPSAAGRPISLLVLDTSQYYYQPMMEYAALTGLPRLLTFGLIDLQLAGTHGNLLETQVASVDWMTDAMSSEGRRWIVASHHPYSDLGRYTPPRFDRIRAAGGVPVTLSGHTHTGEIRWNHDGDNEGDWLEINVGSLLDAPAEYRDFQVQRVAGRLAVSSPRYDVADVLRGAGLLTDGLPGCRPSPGDPDWYMSYRTESSTSELHAERVTKRLILAAYLRMFRLFPTDTSAGAASWPTRADGRELRGDAAVLRELADVVVRDDADIDVAALTHMLYDLREFDRTRPIAPDRRDAFRAYRLSQAVWAAQAELATWPIAERDVDPDISFLLLPVLAEE